jgi:hypothetical protein
MPLTAEQREVRARNAAYARHHPGADPEELERARIDRGIDALVALAPRMTPEQAARGRQLFRYLPDAPATDTG